MEARAWLYYVTPFQGSYGFTQGEPLSFTIFKMVVDSMIGYWVMLVAGKEAVP